METVEIPIASDMVAFPIDTSLPLGPTASDVISIGAIISGAVESTTEIIWGALAEFPEMSVAVQVTVVIPIGNEEGASFVTEAISTNSSICGCPKSAKFSAVSIASINTSAGAVILGDVVSIMEIICSLITTFP